MDTALPTVPSTSRDFHGNVTAGDGEAAIARQKLADSPPVDELLDAMEQTIKDSSTFLSRLQANHDTARCLWNGQSSDGRKHQEAFDDGKVVFPWEGASDARVRLAEEIGDDNVLLLMQAFYRSTMQAVPREANDAESASVMTLVLRHLFENEVPEQTRTQIKRLLNWREDYGHAVLAVGWREQTETVLTPVDAETLLAEAADGAGQLAADQGATPDQIDAAVQVATSQMEDILDPESGPDTLADMLADRFADPATGEPEVSEREATRAATELQRTRQTEVQRTRIRWSRPHLRALLPFVDVFYPTVTDDMSEAAWVAEVEWFTEVDLRSRAAAEGWDEKWLAQVLDHPGSAFEHATLVTQEHSWALTGTDIGQTPDQGSMNQRFQVVHCYYRGAGDDGHPVIYRTILHPQVRDSVALHEANPYAHGAMPYVAVRRESKSRSLMGSRGIGEIVTTDQLEIKIQRDATADGTTIAALPPLTVPANRMAGELSIRPLGRIPVTGRTTSRIDWFPPPPAQGHQRSTDVENARRIAVDRYFRRFGEGVPELLSTAQMQGMVDDFLLDMGQVVRLTAANAQQFMRPVKISRIAGLPVNIEATRESIQGQFDLTFAFDARDLNLEFVESKVKMAQALMQLDGMGVIDQVQLIRWAFGGLDPVLSTQLVTDAESAAQREQDDELAKIAQIMTGIEPPMKIDGENHALRAQVMQEQLQKNPKVAQTVASDEQVRAIYENRLQQHQFQVQQRQNAVTGRVGVEKVIS